MQRGDLGAAGDGHSGRENALQLPTRQGEKLRLDAWMRSSAGAVTRGLAYPGDGPETIAVAWRGEYGSGLLHAGHSYKSCLRKTCPERAAQRAAPKAQPARKRSGKRTAGSGELWRAVLCGGPPKGSGPGLDRRPDLSGHRTEGRQARRACRLFYCSASGRGTTDGISAHRSTTSMSTPARAWSTSAAGTCRSTTARRSRSTTPCAAPRACSTSRTCASSTCAAPGARVPAAAARQRRRALKQPGKALYSCMLQEDGGVIDDLIVYYLDDRGTAWS